MRRRTIRLFAAALLALILPIQGWAAACAQICASMHDAQLAQMAAMHQSMMAEMDPAAMAAMHEAGDDTHCDNTMGAGKCCKAHTFMIAVTDTVATTAPPTLDVASPEISWASFIPEVPDHPPTVVLMTA